MLNSFYKEVELMMRVMRSLALAACLAALCGGGALLIAGCSHEGSGRVATDPTKRPIPAGGYNRARSGMAATMPSQGGGSSSGGASGGGQSSAPR